MQMGGEKTLAKEAPCTNLKNIIQLKSVILLVPNQWINQNLTLFGIVHHSF
jgi:hypothetical protein